MDVTSTVILNSPDEDVKEGLADYVLFPEFVPAPEPPKLGVIINETEEGVEIEKVIKGTPAYKAGIKKGDILLSLDDRKIKGLDDLKIFLLNKNKGDKIRVTLRRSIFIFGTEDITVDLTL
jgi:C-terminal processing protease CtpA/Prc